ncbi:MAG: glutamate-1-semialdehyde 2,1-aminomutase [Candidatus Sericytochromatia bacterium]|nr:glutamate-1-semialdehyde 2,1-aminomutase [Candidatus Sericytochromatia bacterium]
MTTTLPFSAPRSQALWTEAQQLIPGGVNSPVRAFKSVGGDPVFVARAEGAWLEDVDGRTYVDMIGAWGPMILGHAHPVVREALTRAAADGFAFGAPTAAEVDMARAIRRAMPAMEMVRLVNSGTEATMSALRLARAFTGRDKIVKFSGCYHGHADFLLVKAGSGVATLGLPDSPGVPAAVTANTLTADFNDRASVERLFSAHGAEIAGVIVEPVVGNSGTVAPEADFLGYLREVTRQHGALLIFDEVMTGFRVAYGGAQALYGVTPDLTCLGKIVGGGVPVGAYGGRADIMATVAPAGPMYQAGTMSGNPLATAAGLATLTLLAESGVYERLEATSAAIEQALRAAAQAADVRIVLNRVGSMLTVFFTDEPVTGWPTADRCDRKAYGVFFHAMLSHGVYFPPAQFEACFISLAHGEREVAAIAAAARAAFRAVAEFRQGA